MQEIHQWDGEKYEKSFSMINSSIKNPKMSTLVQLLCKNDHSEDGDMSTGAYHGFVMMQTSHLEATC